MPDDAVAAQVTETASEPTEPQIESVAPATADPVIDKRIKGFQRVIATKDAELADMRRKYEEAVEAQRTASMSEEERAQYQAKKRDTEVEELRAQLALAELAGEYPDELPVYRSLLAGKTAKENLDILRKYLKGKAAAEPEEGPDSDVDPNNPPRTPAQSVTMTPNGVPMTAKLADSVLRQFGGGWLRRGR